MTLGGLALAIGMLVDDATVEIENIHRNSPLGQAAHASPSSTALADRRAGHRGHARHLHRLLPGGAALRAGEVPVHAAGAGGGARDAGLLPALADAGADPGPAADGQRARTASAALGAGASASRAASTPGAIAPSSASRMSYGRCSEPALHHRAFTLCIVAVVVLARQPGVAPVDRHRLLSLPSTPA